MSLGEALNYDHKWKWKLRKQRGHRCWTGQFWSYRVFLLADIKRNRIAQEKRVLQYFFAPRDPGSCEFMGSQVCHFLPEKANEQKRCSEQTRCSVTISVQPNVLEKFHLDSVNTTNLGGLFSCCCSGASFDHRFMFIRQGRERERETPKIEAALTPLFSGTQAIH